MKTRNKTNLILLIILALFLTLACSDEEGKTENTTDDNVESTTNSEETTTDEADSEEEEEEEEDDAEESSEPKNNTGPTTVKFSGGKTSKAYKHSVKSGKSHTYYISASEGQTMDIKLKSPKDDALFLVYDPAGDDITGGEEAYAVVGFNEELRASGKYKIVVSSEKDVSYDIAFKVSAKAKDLTANEAAGGANKTVKFGKGNSSASYSNSVIRGDRDTYNLGARAGQFMTVTITSGENNASFQIVAPNGEDLVEDDNNWTGELPANGNYKIIVGGTRGNATYTIKFSVAQSKIRD